MTLYGSLLSAGYTGDNLRAWKQTAAGRTYFLYDGGTPVIELNSSGTVTAVNTFGATGLLSQHTSAGSVFYQFDPQGSVTQRLDSNQNVLTTLVFDAYGNELSGGSTGEPWGYGAQAGYFTDSETGLILCTHRYYDASAGRWLNRDPIGAAGGVNLYTYVGNGPIGGTDPSGWQDPGGTTEGSEPIPGEPDDPAKKEAQLPFTENPSDIDTECREIQGGGVPNLGSGSASGGDSGTAPSSGGGGGGGGAAVYIPSNPTTGQPVSLPQRRVNTQDVPIPHPCANGAPHTMIGGRVGVDGAPYRQTATFPGATWPPAPDGCGVPL